MAMAPSPSLAQVYTSPVAVAVWEWQDGLGTWHPYSAAVCSYIEHCLALHPALSGVGFMFMWGHWEF